MPRPADAPAVYLLSDYGTADEFVGVVHAVLHRLAPSVPVIDLSHQVPPFDVAAGAAMLVRSALHLGAGVVMAVVDPGVGTGRRAVAVGVDSRGPSWLVGPDNGLLVPLGQALGGMRAAFDLDPGPRHDRGPTATFDGRDVFAPAAAHLVGGGRPGELGPEFDPLTLVPLPSVPVARPEADGSGVVTGVDWIDRFGNAQLQIGPSTLVELGLSVGAVAWVTVQPAAPGGAGSGATVRAGPSRPARWVGGFGQLDPAELGLLIDANGRMALVLDRASAASALGVAGGGGTVRIAVAPPSAPAL
ncbi:MAG: SAM-dependent chlorinase/fluorinase [Acidimicrobiales bacterium]